MVTEQDFISAFQAYHDALQDPAAQIDSIRPLVNDHVEKLIENLPGSVVQNAARERAMKELDRIEEMTKKKAEEMAEKMPAAEPDNWEDSQAQDTASPPVLFIEPENPHPGAHFSVGFSGSSGDNHAWIGIFTPGAGNGEHQGRWNYVGGSQTPGEAKTAGAVTFDGLGAGEYEVRLFGDNGHDRLMTSTSMIVSEPEPEP
ncbi:MAG TPA: hypothetical protein D7I10_03250, partial [Candidatus Poseidoniales archaeon]